MKKKAFILTFSALAVIAFSVSTSSCRKSAYPRDPYRGASANPKSHPVKRDNAKATRSYRSVRVKPTY